MLTSCAVKVRNEVQGQGNVNLFPSPDIADFFKILIKSHPEGPPFRPERKLYIEYIVCICLQMCVF